MGLSKNIKQNKQTYNTPMYKENGTETKDEAQTIQRWAQWIQTHFTQTTKENQSIQIEHIKEEIRGQVEQNIQDGTQAGAPGEIISKIRQKTSLYKGEKRPEITKECYKKVLHHGYR